MIRELKDKTSWMEAYPVMHELRTHLSMEEYLSLLDDMVAQGYRMFALYDDNEIVAVTGFIELVNFYNLRHLYVYDLVVKATERSHGYGAELLGYIHDLADQTGAAVSLTSGLQRTDAHRFYEKKMGYQKTSYAFVRK